MKRKSLLVNSLVLALSALTAPVGQAGTLDLYYLRHLEQRQHPISLSANSIKTAFFTQWVSHQDYTLGTFQQRFYLDESYASGADAPVFFYICGESSCEPTALMGAIREQAKIYGARLIALEHRYYGVSLPRKTFSASDLQYLTTDFALRDLENFQVSMQNQHGWTGKWIAFGGSYPGSLSAYYRLRYPQRVAGSLASSAPVQAKENFEEYDEHVTKVAGVECAQNMRAATAQIEASLPDVEALNELKLAFGVPTLRDNQDFLFFVADIGAAAVQYGYRNTFCSMLASYPTPLAGYAAFASYLYDAWHIEDPLSLSTQGAESENPANYAEGIGGRQWYYQSCTEYGYWQNAHHDASKSTRSAQVNAEYFSHVCKRLFGINVGANTALINHEFYQPLLSEASHVSRIYFTNGANDPWSKLSLTIENGNATNPKLNYTTIAGAAHCDDLRRPKESDTDAVKQARLKLTQYIKAWLTA